jgi:hypothetical protein
MLVEALYAHCPRDDLKPPNSIKHRPSARLNYAIWRSINSEGILFGLARDKSAVGASPDYAVENQNRYSVLLSLDYIPSLSDFAYQVTSAGKQNRGLELAEIAETPKTRSTGTDVLEPHLAARARIDRARKTKRMVTTAKSSATTATAGRNLNRSQRLF